jgi:peptidoglycan/xylan/chitin deacetylase (PgdA/CDA1 family)
MKPPGALERTLIRTGARVFSPGGRRGSLLVLIFHRVLAQPDALLSDEPDARAFAEQMDVVKAFFNVIGLQEAVERLKSGSLPPRAVCITFDDGYANNVEVAAPILAARGLTATFFISTGFMDGSRMWNDTIIEALRSAPAELDLTDLGLGKLQLAGLAQRRRVIDGILLQLKYRDPAERLKLADAIAQRAGFEQTKPLMMSETQLRKLASLGMDIGAHCVTHPILARLPSNVAREEINQSRARLQDVLRQPVRTFAYPNGGPGTDYASEHVTMVREAGFSTAVTTAWGAGTRDSDPYQIPRVGPWDRTSLRYGLRMLRGFTQRNATRV